VSGAQKRLPEKIADNFWEFMNAEVRHWQKYAAEYDTF
jgi:hypothetical protein